MARSHCRSAAGGELALPPHPSNEPRLASPAGRSVTTHHFTKSPAARAMSLLLPTLLQGWPRHAGSGSLVHYHSTTATSTMRSAVRRRTAHPCAQHDTCTTHAPEHANTLKLRCNACRARACVRAFLSRRSRTVGVIKVFFRTWTLAALKRQCVYACVC
jgi:hypothetical protein